MDDRLAVAELRSVLHFDRYPAELLEQVFPDQAGMPGSTAGDDQYSVGVDEFIFMVDDAGQRHMRSLHINAAAHAVLQCFRLFENLFQHKMGIASFFQLAQIHFQLFDLGSFLDIGDRDNLGFLVPVEHRNFLVFQIDNLVCIFYDRRGIGSDEKFIIPDAYNERAAFPGNDQLIRIPLLHHGNGIGADDMIERDLHGFKKIAGMSRFDIFNVLDQDFGIRIALEGISLLD